LFYRIIKRLTESYAVSSLKVLELVEESESGIYILKLRANLIDGSQLFITEVHTLKRQKYAYHWQNASGKLKVRWDNSPHWKNIPTFPHHKHIGSQVVPSVKPSIDEVMAEIEEAISNLYQNKSKKSL